MDQTTKKVIQLRQTTEMTWGEIGGAVGLSETAARSRYYRAKKRGDLDVSDETLEISGEGNEVEVVSSGVRIQSLEDLVEAAEIDLDEYQIVASNVRTWEGYIKTGPKGRERIAIKTLYGVHAKFEPLAPRPVKPTVQPVRIEFEPPERSPGRARDHFRAVCLFDPQIGFRRSLRTGELDPFHDRVAIDVGVQIVEALVPDVVVLGGDWLDLSDWTKRFTRSPEFYWTTQPSGIEAGFINGRLRAAVPEAEITMVPGNHEKRMNDLLIEGLKEGYELRSINRLQGPPALSLENLMALPDLDIELLSGYPNGSVWLPGDVEVKHGDVVSGKSGGTVQRVVQGLTHSQVFGHIHRREVATRTVWDPEPREIFALSPGCLCRVGPGGPPGQKERQNWQQGVAVVDVFDGQPARGQIVPITDGFAYFEGLTFEGVDYREELIEASRHPKDGKPWPF